jgi:hypothetical protein
MVSATICRARTIGTTIVIPASSEPQQEERREPCGKCDGMASTGKGQKQRRDD